MPTLPSCRAALLALLATGVAAPVSGQDAHAGHARHASPYADLTDRAIKALSPDEVAGLEAGEGLGFALAAELNGVPGPLHTLEMAEALGLSADQAAAVRAVREEMTEHARSLGTRILALEAELDRGFADGTATADDVTRLTAAVGAARGELRGVHLTAHLRTTALLSPTQRAAYAHLRGYVD